MDSANRQIVWSGVVDIDTDYFIPVGTTVTIQPGTSVRFLLPKQGSDLLQEHPHFVGSELIVMGELIAEGTLEQPILFTADNPQKGAGSWGGINIDGGRVSISYCYLSQADSAIHARDASVLIRESIFTDNLVAIRFNSSDIRAENNTIYQNGTGVRFHYGSPTIRNNLLQENNKSIFITDTPLNYRIESNYVIDSRVYHAVLGEPVSENVDLKKNCWSPESTTSEPLFFDRRVDDYLGQIVVDPVCSVPFSAVGASWIK